MLNYFLVMLGGALGSAARFWISGVVALRYGEAFRLGTLLANITGCFLVGIIAALSDPTGRMLINAPLRAFLMIGFCGGYTTFSSFSLQTLTLLQEGEWFRAMANSFGSLFACLAAVWLGYLCTTAAFRS